MAKQRGTSLMAVPEFKLKLKINWIRGTSINDVPRFLAIFDLPTYLVLLYNVPFWGYLGPPYLP